MKSKILIIEDDKGITKLLRASLVANSYDVLTVDSCKSGIDMIASHCPDVILLDLGMPDMDGVEVIKQVRTWSATPIIVISARSDEQDKAEALDLGADDYITKPFGTVELLARIRAAIRHTRTGSENDDLARRGIYEVGGLVIDYNKHKVYRDGQDARLTPNEFRIVALL